MASTDPPIVNIRKAIRDSISLHRRLSLIPDSDSAKCHLIQLKNALIKQYEQLGGEFETCKWEENSYDRN